MPLSIIAANLIDLVARKRRSKDELQLAEQWLPALMAAAETMEALAAQEGEQAVA